MNVLIIGGGVIGLAAARELRLAGAGRVTVLEKGQAGREASWAAAGMLAPDAETETVDAMYRLRMSFILSSRRRFSMRPVSTLSSTERARSA